MAAKKGKTTKKAGTKGKKAQNSYSFRDEIIILLTLAVAILLILINFTSSGSALYKILMISVLIQTDFPDPVAPAIRR